MNLTRDYSTVVAASSLQRDEGKRRVEVGQEVYDDDDEYIAPGLYEIYHYNDLGVRIEPIPGGGINGDMREGSEISNPLFWDLVKKGSIKVIMEEVEHRPGEMIPEDFYTS